MALLTQLELRPARSTSDDLSAYEFDDDLNELIEVNQELAKMTARDIYNVCPRKKLTIAFCL